MSRPLFASAHHFDRCPSAPVRATCDRPSWSSPASRVRLARLDPGATYGFDKASAEPVTGRAARPAGRPPGQAVGRGASGPSSSSCRASTPPARTARSTRSWRRSTRRAAWSRRSRSRRPRSSAHDFLWRIHKRTPRKGEIGIFNRSHYEDVLVVRVHDLVPKAVWSKRYDQINAFEETLAAGGHDDRQVLPVDRSRRAARRASRRATTTRPSAGSSRWATSRSASAGTTTRRRSTRRCPKTSTGWRAVVRHPGQPQVVPQPRRRHDPGRHDRRTSGRSTRARRTCPRTSSSNRGGRARRSAIAPSAALAAPEQRPEDPAHEVLAEPRGHDLAAGPDRRVDRLAGRCAASAAAFSSAFAALAFARPSARPRSPSAGA